MSSFPGSYLFYAIVQGIEMGLSVYFSKLFENGALTYLHNMSMGM